MPLEPDSPLISTAWLADHLSAPDLRIVDASWYLPQQQRDAKTEYEAGHIPGALFFDIDEIADLGSPYPHMLPPPEKFSSRVRALGIGDGHRVVVYDGAGLFSAPRVWWMFRVMGHADTVVLDGGLVKWRAEGRPIENRVRVPSSPRHFTTRVQNAMVRDREAVLQNIETKAEQVVDARSAGRFSGTEPEPRAGIASGHIPGSRNLPFTRLLNTDGTLKADAELASEFRQAGVDLERPVTTSCGSGVTAAVLALALCKLGKQDVALYDGSWSEWGSVPGLPVET